MFRKNCVICKTRQLDYTMKKDYELRLYCTATNLWFL